MSALWHHKHTHVMSSMKQLIKDLVPPMAIKAIKNFVSARAPLFDTYQQALNACCTEGYQASDLVDVVIEKNVILRNEISSSHVLPFDSLRAMICLGALHSMPRMRVLDFGGGGGTHYSIVRASRRSNQELRWNVVETTGMAEAARKKLVCKELNFFDDIEEAAADLGHVDLVLTSGALQYTPDPLGFLLRLLAVKGDHLFITRTAFNGTDNQVVSIQKSLLSNNGPGSLPPGFKDRQIKYPVIFASRRQAKSLIEESYKIRFSICEDKDAYSVCNQSLDMFGYFCDLK